MHRFSYPLKLFITIVLQFGWSLWITVVCASNLFSIFYGGGNFELIRSTTALYHVPGFLNITVFIGVILWQIAIGILFWYSCIQLVRRKKKDNASIQLAYIASLSLWFTFIILDEVFLNYRIEVNHLIILIAQLTSLAYITSLSSYRKRDVS